MIILNEILEKKISMIKIFVLSLTYTTSLVFQDTHHVQILTRINPTLQIINNLHTSQNSSITYTETLFTITKPPPPNTSFSYPVNLYNRHRQFKFYDDVCKNDLSSDKSRDAQKLLFCLPFQTSR